MEAPLPGNGPDVTRVLIAGDAEVIRRGLRDVLGSRPSFVVVGEEDVDNLGEACAMLEPHLLLLSLSRDDDVGRLREVLAGRPGLRTLVLLEEAGGEQAIASISAGAAGVLLLGVSSQTLLAVAHDIAQGGAALDPCLVSRVFACLRQRLVFAHTDPADRRVDPSVLRLLSGREGEVLRLLARGHRNREIGVQLGVSLGTVKTHMRHIFRKLDVADRTEAVVVAIQGRAKAA